MFIILNMTNIHVGEVQMSIYKLRILNEVVRTGSFTKAADNLGYTQSGVSHAVTSLEDEYGFKLVTRKRGGVSLTSNGEQVIKFVKEVISWNEKLEQTVDSINGNVKGKIRIGTFTSISIRWLPAIIKNFMKDYPDIEFELIDGDYLEVEDWIYNREVDCGFVNLSSLKRQFKTTPLKDDKMLAVLPAGHPFEKMSKIPVQSLNGEAFILPGEGLDGDVGNMIKEHSLDLNIRYFARNDHATLAMVESGLGISILPEMLLENISHGLVVREFEECTCRYLAFATLPADQRTPVVDIFEGYVEEVI